MKDLKLLIWTHPSYNDIWPMFFGQLKKHASFFQEQTVMVPEHSYSLPDTCKEIRNNENEPYYKRFMESVGRVKEKYVLILFEDYILYDDVDEKAIRKIVDFLEESEYSFVRLIRSAANGGKRVAESPDLYEIPLNNGSYLFSLQASIWKRADVLKLYDFYKPATIQESEVYGTAACRSTNVRGCYTYNNEPKRGRLHYDSSVFPYMATAITGGSLGRKACWLTSHYEQELQPLFETYNIDPAIRGTI